jgi:hypothetical protein
MRFRCASEREGLRDHWTHATSGKERPHLRFELTRDQAFLRGRPRAERGPGQCQPLEHDRMQIDLDPAAFDERDLDEAPLEREAGDVPRHVAPAHHVEDHVHTPAVGRAQCGGNEVRVVIVDGELGAERTTRVALLG